jgi:DNA-binding response OmpR family regulator
MSVEAVGGAGPHVLVLEDDAGIAALYREALTDEGYRVTLAADPGLAPAAIADLGADLVLLDLHLGGGAGGISFLERLKADPDTAPIPVLVCSGDRRAVKELADLLAAWDCGVLSKPFDLDTLLAAARACVARRPPRAG